MPNGFSKEERVLFDDLLEGFNDQLVISSMVSKFTIPDVTAERANNIIWRPMPYIMPTVSGIDVTGQFQDVTQLSVPASLNFQRSALFSLNALELRDSTQAQRITQSAIQKLASDVNVSLSDTAALQGTLFVKRTGTATGFDDVAQADALMNENGIGMDSRYMLLNSRDYNGMAGNLAARSTMNEMPTKAYRKAYIGDVAGFETVKADYSARLLAAAGVTVTVNGANQRAIPKAVDATQLGKINFDNRYQNLTIGVVSGLVKVGDAFTIANVFSVHPITKLSTAQLKTFRITAIVSGGGGSGVVQISPPIFAADVSPTAAETQYKNVTATPANGAAITFLNTASAFTNPFWHRDAIELLPGHYVMPPNGIDQMKGTTDQGIQLIMLRLGNINNLSTQYRISGFWGTVMTQPDMGGIMMFNQP